MSRNEWAAQLLGSLSQQGFYGHIEIEMRAGSPCRIVKSESLIPPDLQAQKDAQAAKAAHTDGRGHPIVPLPPDPRRQQP